MRTLLGIGIACAVMASLPARGQDAVRNARPAAEPRGAALWVEPLGTVALGVEAAFYMPFGLSVPMTDHAELVFELTPAGRNDLFCEPDECWNFWGGYLGLGATFHLGSERLNGLFVQPKLVYGGFYRWYPSLPNISFPSLPPQLELSLGVDIGYQWTLGPFYIAPALGASVGYGWNVPSGLFPEPIMDWSLKHFSNRLIWGMNVNLLRVVAVF